MTSNIQATPPVERPRVELVEEIPSPEAAARKAFVSGAITSGILCAVVGTVVGFVLGVQSSSPRRRSQEDQ